MNLNENELKVLKYLIDWELEVGIPCHLSSEKIGKQLDLTRHFTRKAINSLVEKEIITSTVSHTVRITRVNRI